MNPLSMLVEEAEAAVVILRPLKCRRKDFGQNLAVVAVVGKDCWNLNCRYFAYSWKSLLKMQ